MLTMTFADYAESQDWLSTAFDENYWENQGINTEQYFERLLQDAKNEGITITDAGTCDFDTILYQIYQDCYL